MSAISTTLSQKLNLKNPVIYGWTMAFVTILAFSFQPTFSKIILNAGLGPTPQIFLRFLLATILFVVVIAVKNPQRLRIDWRGGLICMGAGVAFSLGAQSFTISLTLLDSSVAAMTFAVYPLFVLATMAFRGEKFTYRNGIRLTLGLMGVFLLIGPGGQVNPIGILYVLGACVVFSMYIIVIQYLKDYHPQTILLYVMLTTTVFQGGLWTAQGGHWEWPAWQAWLGLALLVIVCTYFAQQALFAAVQNIGSSQMALLNPLEPFLTVLWSSLLLQEYLSPIQWIGSGFILFSMMLAIERIGQARTITWRPRLRLRV